MKVVIIDNHDSFTYNLVEYIDRVIGVRPKVLKNDELQVEDLITYNKLILSPGPGIPDEAGKLLDIIKFYSQKKSILGICLGHQAIGEVFGAKLLNTKKIHHGIATETIQICETPIFKSVPKTFEAGRYHSWLVSHEDFPYSELDIIAKSHTDEIMGIQHKKYDITGLQFHPESILTPYGFQMIQNWLEL